MPRIAIVGAGIAGLNAALTLQDAGLSCSIYEASDRIGGRMHSDSTTWADGMVSEWCGEFIDGNHETIHQLIKRFGLHTIDLERARAEQAQNIMYFCNRFYGAEELARDFQALAPLLGQQVQEAGFPTTHTHFTQEGFRLDHLSVSDWIEQYVTGGHSSNMGQLLDVAYNEEYGRETKLQSSLNLVYLLGFQPQPGNFRIFGASDERYHIVGGNQQLPTAIAASLPAGSINLNWRMTTIATNSDGRYTLTFSTPSGPQSATFDRVILTIPFSVLRTLNYKKAGFDNLKQTAITQLGYGTNSKLQLQFDSRFWNGTGAWPGVSTGNIYTDAGFQNAWDVTRGQPGATGIIVDYTGGNIGASFQPNGPYSNSSDPLVQQYAQNFLKQLEEVWPGATAHYNGTATLSHPGIDPNLLGSYACWLVGQYTLFSGYEKARQGKIHFAGEHCSINFQGFMEGGAQEGARAANEILADYKSGIFP